MRSPAAEVTERRAALAVLLAFAFVSVLFTGQVRPFPNPNELSRFEAIYSFVENGTLRDRRRDPPARRPRGQVAFGRATSIPTRRPAWPSPGFRSTARFGSSFRSRASSFEPIFVLLRMLVVTPVCLLALARFFTRLQAAGRAGRGPRHGLARVRHELPLLRALLLQPRLDGGPDPALARPHPAGGRGGLAPARGVPALGGRTARGMGGDLRVSARDRRGSAPRALRHPGPQHHPRRLVRARGARSRSRLLLAYNAACFGSPFVLSSAREASPRYAELARHGLVRIRAAEPHSRGGLPLPPGAGRPARLAVPGVGASSDSIAGARPGKTAPTGFSASRRRCFSSSR